MKTPKPNRSTIAQKRSKAVRRKEATLQNIAVLRGRLDNVESHLVFFWQEIHDIKFRMKAKE